MVRARLTVFRQMPVGGRHSAGYSRGTCRAGTPAGVSIMQTERAPAWAAALGGVAVLFGALMAAAQGNELLTQSVLAPGTAAARNIPADCRQDEAEQEGVSLAECELMVANVRIMLASRPSWFRGVQSALACAGTLAAFGSIFIGMALVDYRRWAPRAAVAIFGLLVAIDVAEFAAALYTGPLLRALYLWNIFLWFTIHLCLTAGAAAGRRAEGV
jgi:hypothetical protein